MVKGKENREETLNEIWEAITEIKWNCWKNRCENFIKWERENGIEKKDKRKYFKKRLANNNEYTELKLMSNKMLNNATNLHINNIFFKGHSIYDEVLLGV